MGTGRTLGSGQPVGIKDPVDLSDGRQERVQMLGVAHLKDELADCHPIPASGLATRQDIDTMVGQHLSDVRKQMGPVQGLHLNLDHESALFACP